MSEMTIEQLQEEISILKETISSLRLMNDGWQKQLDRQQALSEAESKRHQKENVQLNMDIADLTKESQHKDEEICGLQKKAVDLNDKLQTEIHYADSLKTERDELLKRLHDEKDRYCGSFLIDFSGSYKNLIESFLSNGYEVRIIPDRSILRINVLESEDK